MPPAKHLGEYTLENLLAIGGMAEIWLARREGPAGFSKRLVIKRILPNLAQDEKFREMFLDEARVAANLEHPNIVRIYELGEVDGSYFIAMEYVDGPDLDYLIERAAQLGVVFPSVLAARIVADALAGLDYAHTVRGEDGQPLGLVHRDISPHNVMVNRSGVVKVCDFGVAKAATSRHKTQAGAVKGKFAYMSPEQIAAKPLDGRSDLFGMGIVLYELTTNQRPFGDADELLAVTAILTQRPQDPRTFVDDFPPDLERIIMRALAKNRDERYANAREMQADLERFIQGRGEILGPREISAYMDDLLSESPSFYDGAAPPLEPRFAEELEAHPGLSVATSPRHDDALADTAESDRIERPGEVPDTEEELPVTIPEDAPEPPVTSSGGGGASGLLIAAAGLVVLALVAVAAAGAWYFATQPTDPDPDKADVGVVATADTGHGAERDAEAEPDVAKAPEVGKVVVVTSPASTVYYDGKSEGRTPVKLKLPVGKQTIVLRDLKNGISRSIEVDVKSGKPTEVLESFEFGMAKLRFPSGKAKLAVDGVEWKGDLKRPLRLSTGTHALELTMQGRTDPLTASVTIKAGETATVKFE